MTIFYCTWTMGGTSRGVGILKALGEGLLVTPFPLIAEMEGIEPFAHIPRPLADDLIIYDRIKPCRDKGKRIYMDREPLVDVDMVIDWPILSHELNELDLNKAKDWWESPILVGGSLIHSIMEDAPRHRILAARGGDRFKTRDWEKNIMNAEPNARILTYHPRRFYWPALELMSIADQVIGETQVQNEWLAARGLVDPEGAKRAAAEIKRLLK